MALVWLWEETCVPKKKINFYKSAKKIVESLPEWFFKMISTRVREKMKRANNQCDQIRLFFEWFGKKKLTKVAQIFGNFLGFA